MASDQPVSTVVLIDSRDVTGSIGRPGFLQSHLRPATDSGPTVEVLEFAGSRCDVLAQRLVGHDEIGTAEVPAGLQDWYSSMTTPVDVPDTASLFIMSMADTVSTEVWRHDKTGLLVQLPPAGDVPWTDDQSAWFQANFAPVPPTDEQLTHALTTIAKCLEETSTDLVVFNTSTYIPGEKVYWFRHGDPEATSVRAARANLALEKLVKELDLTLVDVDRITAELGAGTAVIDTVTYSQDTLAVLAEEAIAMILDLEAISSVFASDAMQLTVPRYDRRTTVATLTRWHVAAGASVDKGDALFDLRFGNLHAALKNDGRETDKAMSMSVLAGRAGFVDAVTADVGTSLAVGARVGIVTSSRDVVWEDIENAASFPVGIKVEARDDE